jgi:hypothetical protein
MSVSKPPHSTAYAGQTTTLLARVSKADGVLIQTDEVSEILVESYDLDTRSLIDSETIEPDSNDDIPEIHNTLHNDDRWTSDEDGFNFEYVMPGEFIPKSNKTYRIQIELIPTSGDTLKWAYDIETLRWLD